MRASVRRNLENAIRYHEAVAKQAEESDGQKQNNDPRGEEQQQLLSRTTDLPEGEPDERDEDRNERQDMAGPKLEGEGQSQEGEKRGGSNGAAQIHREAAKQLRQVIDAEPEVGGFEQARQDQTVRRNPGTASTRVQQAARDERARYMQQQRRARP